MIQSFWMNSVQEKEASDTSRTKHSFKKARAWQDFGKQGPTQVLVRNWKNDAHDEMV